MMYEIVLFELSHLSKIEGSVYEINIATIYDRNVYFILILRNIHNIMS